ncbi:uncharacterized protein CANTADRAFT_44398 [Suhomyces tanzawaensis NRRL Y-17324]|uniref:Uncharacterized protein n=1 Tax=Suhomyces tanzawaensis NRRL Y-17324 TaxID=984487 RepID=A0A1E4SS61_9ASCO|nr:uncharacterized protein CANTADRAFT_44398 [Suhomyces tanzawaensis NRRL Y-17324]ODV82344.1 hypothetical protein CANTADRAFT_44398 [Suhomyces tanzawaensis NRRL Y-17324]
MTQENPGQSVADAYKQITEAETQAANLEKMLDQLDAKMDAILKEAESINHENDADIDSEQQTDLV